MSGEVSTIHVSIGTAAVLGLAQTPMQVAPTTAYLMLGGRCAMNCLFCTQARGSLAADTALSRITWPEFPLPEVCARLSQAERDGSLKRCCIQVTAGHAAYEQTLFVVQAICQAVALPLDTAILPAHVGQVQALIAAGVDHIGFGLDAACERVFAQVKSGTWAGALDMITQTATRFPCRAAVHLIVGLGETEREMVERIIWAHERGIVAGLFAFTPLRGTPLADHPPPPLDVYRRMQAARWLITHREATQASFIFDQAGRLCRLEHPDWAAWLQDGKAFRTSGCPDCNRPFYNERPGGVMYNYAGPLTAAEAEQAIRETRLSH